MTDVKLNYLCYIAILETIWQSANKTISIWEQYLKLFNFVQTNELWLV